MRTVSSNQIYKTIVHLINDNESINFNNNNSVLCCMQVVLEMMRAQDMIFNYCIDIRCERELMVKVKVNAWDEETYLYFPLDKGVLLAYEVMEA
jgi:hypothetical protein